MPDMTIKCGDCTKEFVFTEKERIFYDDKGLVPPKRCRTCRDIRKQARPKQDQQRG